MQWIINEFVFDSNRKLLTSNITKVILEPKASALLDFFCMNSNRDITRDELIVSVWQGQIVSDNAINRVVGQLRKAFGDEKNPRRFISTLPKIGYRFIADTQRLKIDSIPQTAEQHDKSSLLKNGMLTAMGLVVLIGIGYFVSKINQDQIVSSNISPLSRLSVSQYHASLSPALNQLLYSMNNEYGSHLVLEDVNTKQTQFITSDSSAESKSGYADNAQWNNAGDEFVYLYQDDEVCELRLHSIKPLDAKTNKTEVLQNCGQANQIAFVFSPDDQIIYFVERKSAYRPFEVYAYDRQQQHRWRLAQPIANGLGNHSIDVHTKSGEILLVSDQVPGKSVLFRLDTIKNSFEKIYDLDYSINTAVWGHDVNTVVHPGPHPSYKLLKTNVATNEVTILASDSRRIATPKRINNSKDYLFVSYLYNRDIELQNTKDLSFNSAVMDYLPELSHNAEQLAFVSKRTGYSQIWLKNFSENTLNAIEPTNKSSTYYNLSWSFNDAKILANTSNGIVIYDANNFTELNRVSITQTAYAASWYSKNEIAYSSFQEGTWQVTIVDVNTMQKRINEKWAFILSSPTTKVYLDQHLQAFNNNLEPMDSLTCAHPIFRFRLNMVLDGDTFYCVAANKRSDLVKWSFEKKPLIQADVLRGAEFYSVSKGELATTKVKSAVGDIMRTNF